MLMSAVYLCVNCTVTAWSDGW